MTLSPDNIKFIKSKIIFITGLFNRIQSFGATNVLAHLIHINDFIKIACE